MTVSPFPSLPTTTDPIQFVRQGFDNLWAWALGNAPWLANPNLRTGVKLTFKIVGYGPALLGAGYSVKATLYQDTLTGGTLSEGPIIATLTQPTLDDSTVTFAFVASLDTTLPYQVDLLITAPDGTTATAVQATLLNPSPGTEWGGVAGVTNTVNTLLVPAGTGTAPVTATVQVNVQVFDAKGNGPSGVAIEYWLYANGGADGVQVATGTTDGSGGIVVNAPVTVVPSTPYKRVVLVAGTPVTVGGDSSQELGSSILAIGVLSATVTGYGTSTESSTP